jgi:hypothetical protein
MEGSGAKHSDKKSPPATALTAHFTSFLIRNIILLHSEIVFQQVKW